MEKDNGIERNKIWREQASLDFSPLATSGFLRLPSGGAFAGDLGGSFISGLGTVFYEQILNRIDS